MRNWPNAVLMLDQRLRRWPTLNQHLVECAVLAGKALTVNMLEAVSSLFPVPHGNTTYCVTTQSPHERCRSSI